MPFTSDQIAQYLQDPLSFPPEFKSWFVKYLEQHQPSLQAGLLAGKLPTSKLTGQIPYSQLTLANSIVSGDIVDGTIVNADISATAAITASRLAGYPTDASKGLDGAGNWTGSLFKIYNTTILSGTSATLDTGAVIPATFSHLRVELQGRSDAVTTAVSILLRLNNDSGANYDYEQNYAQNAAPAHLNGQAQTSMNVGGATAANSQAGAAGVTVIDIPGYAGTTFWKQAVAQSGYQGTSTAETILAAYGNWRNTAAINQITLLPSSGSFIAGSRLTVYGIGA